MNTPRSVKLPVAGEVWTWKRSGESIVVLAVADNAVMIRWDRSGIPAATMLDRFLAAYWPPKPVMPAAVPKQLFVAVTGDDGVAFTSHVNRVTRPATTASVRYVLDPDSYQAAP